ncbi:MAG: hypothetical protein ACSNEK_08350 [Parachlamydiaceae bacterium]
MKKSIVLNCMTAGLFCLSAFSGTQLSAASAIEECSKELLLAYFPEKFVNETLKKFDIPQEKWADIRKGLNEKDKDVIKTVEQRADQMTPNPLKDPQQRQAAVRLFRETLLQLFGDVMRANGITDTKQIQAMLDDIQQQKAKRFAECMEQHRSAAADEDDKDDAE